MRTSYVRERKRKRDVGGGVKEGERASKRENLNVTHSLSYTQEHKKRRRKKKNFSFLSSTLPNWIFLFFFLYCSLSFSALSCMHKTRVYLSVFLIIDISSSKSFDVFSAYSEKYVQKETRHINFILFLISSTCGYTCCCCFSSRTESREINKFGLISVSGCFFFVERKSILPEDISLFGVWQRNCFDLVLREWKKRILRLLVFQVLVSNRMKCFSSLLSVDMSMKTERIKQET